MFHYLKKKTSSLSYVIILNGQRQLLNLKRVQDLKSYTEVVILNPNLIPTYQASEQVLKQQGGEDNKRELTRTLNVILTLVKELRTSQTISILFLESE